MRFGQISVKCVRRYDKIMITLLLVTGEFTEWLRNVVSKHVSVHTSSEMRKYKLVKETM